MELFGLIVVICWVIALFSFVNSDTIGTINEALEIIKPKMKTVKIPRCLKYVIPQIDLSEKPAILKTFSKLNVYLLTFVLTIANYVISIFCIIVAVLFYFMLPSYILYVGIVPTVYAIAISILMFIYEHDASKKPVDKQSFLNFTVSDKKVEDDKSDEMPESMTDNQDECD